MMKNKKKKNQPEILLRCINQIKIKRKARVCFKIVMMKTKMIKKNQMFRKKKASNQENHYPLLVLKKLPVYSKIQMMMNLYKKTISLHSSNNNRWKRRYQNRNQYQLP